MPLVPSQKIIYVEKSLASEAMKKLNEEFEEFEEFRIISLSTGYDSYKFTIVAVIEFV